MDKLVEFLVARWHLVADNWQVFLVGAVLVAGVTFAAANWLFSERIAVMEARLKQKDDLIAEYRDKLSGASPDQAKARMDRLEKELDAIKPRSLSVDARRVLLAGLAGYTGVVVLIHDKTCQECGVLKASLLDAFKAGGWSCRDDYLTSFGRSETGLWLLVKGPGPFTAYEALALSALKAAGLNFEVKVAQGPASQFLYGDVTLQIGAKTP